MGKMWAEKREIFYTHSLPSKSSQNFLPDGSLDFGAMDEFMSLILDALAEHGSRAVRVFPPASGVLVAFADKLAGEVVSEYVTSLLTRARQLGTGVYLRCVAAAFKESWKMVDAIMRAAGERPGEEVVSRTRAEDVVYQMFEVNMDEYLDEEVEALKSAFEGACKEWDRGVCFRFSFLHLTLLTHPPYRYHHPHQPLPPPPPPPHPRHSHPLKIRP